MSRKRKTKLPKDNGRPQLWMRDTSRLVRTPNHFERLRIIYPNGIAEYSEGQLMSYWDTPCWFLRKESIEQLTKRMLAYDKFNGFKTIFLGYL